MTTDDPGATEEPYIRLNVTKSTIAIGGRARVHRDTIARLFDVEKGAVEELLEEEAGESGLLLVVLSGDESVIVRAFWDELIGMDTISLRRPERQKLHVSAGDEVTVCPHTPLSEAMRERLADWFRRDRRGGKEDENEAEEAAAEEAAAVPAPPVEGEGEREPEGAAPVEAETEPLEDADDEELEDWAAAPAQAPEPEPEPVETQE